MLRLFDNFEAVVFFFSDYFLDLGDGFTGYGLVFVFSEVDWDSCFESDFYWPAGQDV